MLITANASLRNDWPIVAVGFSGGLVIESWGTQTQLWTYYTQERPPFAVLAHGMAAVAFWRVVELYRIFRVRIDPSL